MDAEAQKEKLQTAITEFKASISETYDTLAKYVHAFEMDVFVKGSKKPYRVQGVRGALRAQDAIGDDPSKLQDVRVYRDISTSSLGTTRRNQELKMIRGYDAKSGYLVKYPDSTDILNRDTTIEDWRTYEIVQEDIKKTQKELDEAMIAGNNSLANAKRHRIQELQKELETLAPMERWEDNDTASQRATQRASARENALQEFTNLNEEYNSAGRELINEKETIKTNILNAEEEIQLNQQKIDEINTDGRKIAGAKKRLQNRA